MSVGAHNNQQLLACPPFVTVTTDFVIPSAATLNWCRRPFACYVVSCVLNWCRRSFACDLVSCVLNWCRRPFACEMVSCVLNWSRRVLNVIPMQSAGRST